MWLLPELVQLAAGPSGFAQFELFESAVDETDSTTGEEEGATETRIAAVTVPEDSLGGAASFKVISVVCLWWSCL